MRRMKKKPPKISKVPGLLEEWCWGKNTGVSPDILTCGSGKKVWWKCSLGHEWEASPNSRKYGVGCPYCANRKILRGFNDLATIHPALAAEWNNEKTKELTPYDVAPASSKRVWWQCKNGHEWQATVLTRHQGSNCPYCANLKVLRGFNDLASVNPELANEWDYERNSLTPEEVVAGSNKRVWWKCSICGHEWETTVVARNLGQGCQKCADARLSKKKVT